MPDMLMCLSNGTVHTDFTPAAIDKMLQAPDNIVWYDIVDPDDHDVAVLRDEFHFHLLSIEDALRGYQRPKIETYSKYYFLVFYAVCYREDHTLDTQQLNQYLGQNYIVSVHNGEFRQVQDPMSRWRAPESPLGNTIGALLYALLDSIVDDYFPVVDRVAEHIDELEDAIFKEFDQSAIQSIFTLKRDLLQVRRIIAPERDVINTLLRRDMPVFQPEDTVYLQDVYDHVVRVADSLDVYRDLLSSALDSFLSVQSNNLNQIVKVLTIASIILMSAALVAGIYGMNFEFMPELHWRFGYFYALGLMVAISLGIVLFFRHKKWL
jgi:magnesium transporter